MATVIEKWIAGSLVGLAWASAGFGAEVNSITNGQAVLAGTALVNGTTLDVFLDVSISLGSITTGAGAPYVGLYLYGLNQDGSSYGDGRFGSAAAGPPPSNYQVGYIGLGAAVTAVVTGMARGILLPPGSWKFVLHNQTGSTLAASANTVQMRSYNLSAA